MHLVDHADGPAALVLACQPPPFGGGIPEKEVEGATRTEVWGSSFSDPGPDFCEFRVFRGTEQIVTKRTPGY